MSKTVCEFFQEKLSKLTAQQLTDQEVCARYLLLHLHIRHPAEWLSSPRRPVSGESQELSAQLDQLEISLTAKQRLRLVGLKSIHDLINHYYFRGVVLDSHEGLVEWMESRYPLILRLDIPTPDEMLEIQCQGRRYVTLILSPELQLEPLGRHRDACDFMLHDLEHAHKFFGNKATHLGQVKFFKALRHSREAFTRWCADLQFCKDLDYLKSDMNSHPVHLMKYLKAVVLNAEMRLSGERYPDLNKFWGGLFEEWEMPHATRASALRINHPNVESEADLRDVSLFFMPSPPTES